MDKLFVKLKILNKMIKDTRTGEPRPKLMKRKELGSNEFLCDNDSVWRCIEGRWYLSHWLSEEKSIFRTGRWIETDMSAINPSIITSFDMNKRIKSQE